MKKLEKTLFSKKLNLESLLFAFTSLAFLFMIYSLDLNELGASKKLVFSDKEYWRLFISPLLHADLNHLFHNAFFFTGLSFILHGYFGSISFPIISFFAGGIINLITLYFYPPEVQLIGISGVVYFMASFWLTLFILIEKRYHPMKRMIYALGMALIFLFPETFQPQTSYLSHGVGLILGIPTACLFYFLKRKNIHSHELWVETKKNEEVDFDWGEPLQ